MATKQFTAKAFGKEYRYTPERVVYNGAQGHIWKCEEKYGQHWVFSGQQFHPLKATRKEIVG